MNIIVGRGGILTSLIGLFIYILIWLGRAAWVGIMILAFVLMCLYKGLAWAYRKIRARKSEPDSVTTQTYDWTPPQPVMSPVCTGVGPRDWSPPNDDWS